MMTPTFEQKLGILAVNQFVLRLKADGRPISDLMALELFVDDSMHRQGRGGIYGWIKQEDHRVLCGAIDWLLEESDLTDVEIHGFARAYWHSILVDENNYIELVADQEFVADDQQGYRFGYIVQKAYDKECHERDLKLLEEAKLQGQYYQDIIDKVKA